MDGSPADARWRCSALHPATPNTQQNTKTNKTTTRITRTFSLSAPPIPQNSKKPSFIHITSSRLLPRCHHHHHHLELSIIPTTVRPPSRVKQMIKRAIRSGSSVDILSKKF